MKKKLITLFIIAQVFCLQNKIFAQSESASSPMEQIEASTANLKNTIINIDNKDFDYRILKYYTEQELKSMSRVKRNQVYFIYTQSYHVIDLVNCPNLKETDIDVSKLEVLRKEDTNTTVFYGKDCKVSVVLISRKEMKELLDVLNNTNK